jgi:DNA-binding MarR family transcriptional regulator
LLSKESCVNTEADAALHAVFEVNRLLRDAGERVSATAGQTHSRRMVLQAAGDRATVPDIARRLGLQRQSVQRVADELVADGLARYEENPHHRRSRLLVTTAAGKSTLAAIQSAHREWVADLEAKAGALDWARLGADLARIAQAVGDRPRSPG